MKKWLMSMGMFLACCLAIVSCKDDSVELDELTQQTIIMFCPWSGQMMHDVIQMNIDSIESGIKKKKGLGKTRLLVFYSDNSHSARLFELTYKKNTFEQTIIEQYSDNSYTTAQGICNIIKKAKEVAPALNYAMIVGGHGCGWTEAKDWEDYPYRVRRRRAVADDFETRFFGSVDDKDYAIEVEDLAEGIAQSGTKMQYILFDDCYMANVEVAYALRNATNYLVASTSEVMAIGMPYSTMWASLATATPNYSSMVSSFKTFYSNYRTPYGTLSAIDCRKVEDLANVMKQINTRYTIDEEVLDNIQPLDGLKPTLFYDMGDYVKNLCPDPNLYNQFKTSLTNVVKHTANTDSIYSYIYGFRVFKKLETYSGLTISDPSLHSVALKGKERTGWWKATH